MPRPSPLLAALFLVGVGAHAHAQSTAPGDTAPLATVLEQRVSQELAIEGIVLSRRNLRLEIEQLGGKLLISIIDDTVGRTVASTKLDEIPGDREAAVATVTHLVAELVQQTLGHAPAPDKAPPPVAIIDDRAERQQREVAELQFRRQALRFGADYSIHATGHNIGGTTVVSGSVARHWKVFRGELDQELAPADFYRLLERPDLSERYEDRRSLKTKMWIVGGVTGALTLVGIGMMGRSLDAATLEEDTGPSTGWTLFTLGATIACGVSIGYAIHIGKNPHPIPESEAKALADAYNQRLRGQLGLPTASSTPSTIRELRVAAGAGGLVLGGAF